MDVCLLCSGLYFKAQNQTDARTRNAWVGECTDAWMDRWVDEWVGGWMMGRWVGEWMDGWINLFTGTYLFSP